MEQLPTEVIIREANLKAVKQLLKGINETIKAIRKTDDCLTFEYTQQQVQNLLVHIRQDLTHIGFTGALQPPEDSDRFDLPEYEEDREEDKENSEPDLTKVYLNSPRNESQLSL